MLRIALTILALLAIPAPALAAEGFVGITETGQLVRFTSQQTLSMTRPIPIRGLLPGERIVALDRGPGGLIGVGSSARLYAIGLSGRARAIGVPFQQGLRGSRFSLALAPNGTARLVSDVGQDLLIDLTAGGTVQPGPGLSRAGSGEPIRPAVDAAADGLLVGVQLGPRLENVSQLTLFRETALGAPTMSALPVNHGRYREPKLGEPLAFQLGSDGRGYAVAVLADQGRIRQSTMLVVDPATGPKPDNHAFGFLPIRLNTFASLGPVREDRTPPAAQVRLARHVSLQGLRGKRIPLRLSCSESCHAVGSASIDGRQVGSVFGSSFFPGRITPIQFYPNRKERNALRRSAGRRIRVTLRIDDWKRNRLRVVRTARLVR